MAQSGKQILVAVLSGRFAVLGAGSGGARGVRLGVEFGSGL